MIVISRDILYTKAHHDDRFCIHIRIRSLIAKILLQKRNSRCTYVIIMLYWKLIRCRYVPLDHLWSTSILSYQTWPNLNAFRLTSETKTSKVLTLLSVKPTCFRCVIRRWPRRDYGLFSVGSAENDSAECNLRWLSTIVSVREHQSTDHCILSYSSGCR